MVAVLSPTQAPNNSEKNEGGAAAALTSSFAGDFIPCADMGVLTLTVGVPLFGVMVSILLERRRARTARAALASFLYKLPMWEKERIELLVGR